MLAVAGLLLFVTLIGVLFAAVALVALVLKLVFRVAFLPFALVGGLLKLIVLPIVALVLLLVVGPVLLAVGAVLIVPLLCLGGLLSLCWAGLHLVTA